MGEMTDEGEMDYEYRAQLANMSFDEIFDLTAGVYFYFYNCGVGEMGVKWAMWVIIGVSGSATYKAFYVSDFFSRVNRVRATRPDP